MQFMALAWVVFFDWTFRCADWEVCRSYFDWSGGRFLFLGGGGGWKLRLFWQGDPIERCILHGDTPSLTPPPPPILWLQFIHTQPNGWYHEHLIRDIVKLYPIKTTGADGRDGTYLGFSGHPLCDPSAGIYPYWRFPGDMCKLRGRRVQPGWSRAKTSVPTSRFSFFPHGNFIKLFLAWRCYVWVGGQFHVCYYGRPTRCQPPFVGDSSVLTYQ